MPSAWSAAATARPPVMRCMGFLLVRGYGYIVSLVIVVVVARRATRERKNLNWKGRYVLALDGRVSTRAATSCAPVHPPSSRTGLERGGVRPIAATADGCQNQLKAVGLSEEEMKLGSLPVFAPLHEQRRAR